MPDFVFISTPNEGVLDLLAPPTLVPLVNEALRNCQSLLALSRSPLANSALVTPMLVKDDVSPTAEERGFGLRLVLQWAVEQLAPAPLAYPFGAFRPFDDPTWRDPSWWRYNILRHRYLEPLHPDDFVAGGRFTETLLGLTGISSADAFYDERNRAIGEVAEWLRRQLLDGAFSSELQKLALQELLRPLEKQVQASQLLSIAATFDEVFSRELLGELAAREGIVNFSRVLDSVIAQRFLLTGDDGADLWLSPSLRYYLYTRQQTTDLQYRHRLIAAHFAAQDRLLPAVRHFQRGGLDDQAVQLLLSAADDLQQELQPAELATLIQSLNMQRLVSGDRYAASLLLSDLHHRAGKPEQALAACRQALQSSSTPDEQARIYRRMGKLYESRNQQHALRYYQQAIERFAPESPELAQALKDRGWLHFLRQEWQRAEADLHRALLAGATGARSLQGDIYDAMANLYRKTGDVERALRYGELALTLREEDGDLLGVAKSHGNLGLLYRSIGDYAHAIAAYTEAMTTYARIGNQELVAVALLNIGAAYFLDGSVDDAILRYQNSLEVSRTIGLPLIEIKAHYNLAEGYAAADRSELAGEHWQLGYHLCRQYAFDDQEKDFIDLAETLVLPVALPTVSAERQDRAAAPMRELLDADEAAVLEIARRERKLTTQRLMEVMPISRATAARRLTALVEKGYLRMEGKGRGVRYRVVEQTDVPDAASATTIDVSLLDEMARHFRKEESVLRQRFALAALGVVGAPRSGSAVRIIARFLVSPDLQRFFELENYLAAGLRAEIDLLPDTAPAAVHALEQTTIHWVWPAA